MSGEEFFDPWTYLARLGVRMRHPEDVFFSDGDAVCGMRTCVYLTQEDREDLLHKDYQEFNCPAPECPAMFSQLIDFETHYHTLHSHQCSQCNQTLPSAHLLELHLSENHDSFFAVSCLKKKMYECVLAKCKQKFWNGQERKRHCLKDHEFLDDFKFEDISEIAVITKSDILRRNRGRSMSPLKSTAHHSKTVLDKPDDIMEVETHQESQIPRPMKKRGSISVHKLDNLPRSTSPKMEDFKRRNSQRVTTSKVRPLSVMVLSPENFSSKIPVASPRGSPCKKSSVSISKPANDVLISNESGSIRSPKATSQSLTTTPSTPRRKISLSIITGSSGSSNSPRPSESHHNIDDDDSSPEICISSANSIISSSRASESPGRRESLSLARMGDRLSPSKGPDLLTLLSNTVKLQNLDHTSTTTSKVSHNSSFDISSSSATSSNSQTSSINNNFANSPLRNNVVRTSRIPVFKRSQSLKVPKQISFGCDVERAFVPNTAHWHSRKDGHPDQGEDGNKMDFESGHFEQEMRSALANCQF